MKTDIQLKFIWGHLKLIVKTILKMLDAFEKYVCILKYFIK